VGWNGVTEGCCNGVEDGCSNGCESGVVHSDGVNDPGSVFAKGWLAGDCNKSRLRDGCGDAEEGTPM